ncbi:hypothetical protein DFQ29_004747 [Apophysomyces sp. BC1021]|nr:hypothetical protein DFQ29_004747 [Apophysomyces sp. BC1021]
MSAITTVVHYPDRIATEPSEKEPQHQTVDINPSDSSVSGASSHHSSIKKPEVQEKRRWLNLIRRKAVLYFQRYWFLLGLGIMIGLAWAFPQVGKSYGDLQAQYTIKWGAVIVIFLLSGLGLEVRVMLQTILRWRLHLVVQVINFLILPFIGWGIVRFFLFVHADIDSVVYQGWMIALSTSTTVSSNSVMTRNANGNDSAVFGDDRKLFPPGSARGTPDYVMVLKNLGLTVLLPLVVGQVTRFLFPKQIKYLAVKLRFSILNSLALLTMVWSVFCDGVASDAFKKMSGVDIVAILGVDIFMYCFGCCLTIFVARLPWPRCMKEPAWVRRWRFSRQDSVAMMYCGATKTVSMGIPLINVLYSGSSYGVVGVLSLPLLMYHISQLFIGNFQVQILKKWVQRGIDEGEVHHSDDNDDSASAQSQRTLPSTTTRRRPNTDAAAPSA